MGEERKRTIPRGWLSCGGLRSFENIGSGSNLLGVNFLLGQSPRLRLNFNIESGARH